MIANIRADESAAASDGSAPGVRVSFYSEADKQRIEHAVASNGNAVAAASVLFTEEAKAWIVDGQHRTRAMRMLVEKGRLSEDFPVPFKITC